MKLTNAKSLLRLLCCTSRKPSILQCKTERKSLAVSFPLTLRVAAVPGPGFPYFCSPARRRDEEANGFPDWCRCSDVIALGALVLSGVLATLIRDMGAKFRSRLYALRVVSRLRPGFRKSFQWKPAAAHPDHFVPAAWNHTAFDLVSALQ